MIEFKEKFIAFVDILGFKQLVEKVEARKGMSPEELAKLLDAFRSNVERKEYEQYGPFCCPDSPRLEQHLDFRLTAVSDCSIISTEISPAGLINLVSHCWSVVIRFLQHGIMCRGYMTRGRIYHTDSQFLGTGYQNAYEAERQVSVFKRAAEERGTPFIEIDRVLSDYVHAHGDQCVKEMFRRMTRSDGEGLALYPFERLSHSFLVGGFGVKFDPDKEKKSNHVMRQWILGFKAKVLEHVDPTNAGAVKKAEHYIRALDEQLKICDQTDDTIDALSRPFGRTRDV